jgi:hypothetical protein
LNKDWSFFKRTKTVIGQAEACDRFADIVKSLFNNSYSMYNLKSIISQTDIKSDIVHDKYRQIISNIHKTEKMPGDNSASSDEKVGLSDGLAYRKTGGPNPGHNLCLEQWVVV